MAKTIVVGVNGMDGTTLTRILLNRGNQVIGTYRRNTLDLTSIHQFHNNNPNLTFEYCNIHDFVSVKKLIEKYKDVDEIYLLACQSHVALSFESPQTSILDGSSAFNFLENIYQTNKKIKLYFAATSELFGGKYDFPTNEETPFDARSPYSIQKEHCTRWVKYYRQLGLYCCYGILFNHSNQLRSPEFYVRRVTQAAAKIAFKQQNQLVLGNLNFYRDEHFSDFGCEMMIKMLRNDTPKDYVIATGQTHHGEEYLDAAFGYFNLDWKKYVVIDDSRKRLNEVVKLVGDSTKAQKELGWKPNRMSFKDHIAIMCGYDECLVQGMPYAHPNIFDLYP